jgi:5-methylcytosine-specific restriction enzyme A
VEARRGVNFRGRGADTRRVSTRRQRVVTVEQWGKPERNEAGHPICRWCRTPVKPPRRTFCGDACVHEWKIRSSPWYVRKQVKKRDNGTCRLCGFNVVKAHREWTRAKPPVSDRAARRAWRAARPRWEADHIVPVADGGGECGLENYRLLCRPCHVSVTLTWRAQRPRTMNAAHPQGQSGAQ